MPQDYKVSFEYEPIIYEDGQFSWIFKNFINIAMIGAAVLVGRGIWNGIKNLAKKSGGGGNNLLDIETKKI